MAPAPPEVEEAGSEGRVCGVEGVGRGDCIVGYNGRLAWRQSKMLMWRMDVGVGGIWIVSGNRERKPPLRLKTLFSRFARVELGEYEEGCGVTREEEVVRVAVPLWALCKHKRSGRGWDS